MRIDGFQRGRIIDAERVGRKANNGTIFGVQVVEQDMFVSDISMIDIVGLCDFPEERSRILCERVKVQLVDDAAGEDCEDESEYGKAGDTAYRADAVLCESGNPDVRRERSPF